MMPTVVHVSVLLLYVLTYVSPSPLRQPCFCISSRGSLICTLCFICASDSTDDLLILQGQAIFQEGLKACPSSHMFDLYAAWLQERLAQHENDAEDETMLKTHVQQLLLDLCKRAHATGNSATFLVLSLVPLRVCIATGI